MKSKLSWIPFIIFMPVAVFCRIAPNFFEEGHLFGKGSLVPDYLFLAAAALIFLFSVLFCALDSRISPYYPRRRNVLAGLVGLLLSIAFAADGANTLITVFGSGKPSALTIAEGILLVLSAVVLITMSLSSMFRGRNSKPASLLCVIPAVMLAIRMISCFVSFTTISLKLADVTALCCYVFATMFFYHYSVTLSVVESKSGVKNCFVFGLPAAASMLAYGAAKLAFGFNAGDLLSNIVPVEMVLTALFIIVFLIEVSRHAQDRETLTVIGVNDEDPAENVKTQENVDGFLVSVKDESEREDEAASSYYTNTDTTDYLYREVKSEEPAGESFTPDTEGYLTDAVAEDENDDRPKDYASRLDEIDKLILEISEKSD